MRTSYQVGRPWMLDGKILRGLTGTPMRSTARANNSLALAEPEPLTLAKRTTKSFTRLIELETGMVLRRESCRVDNTACPTPLWDSARHTTRNAGTRLHLSP